MPIQRFPRVALVVAATALLASACGSSSNAEPIRRDQPASTHALAARADRYWQRFGPDDPVALAVEGAGIVALGAQGQIVEYRREENEVAWSANLDLRDIRARPALSPATVVATGGDEAVAVDRASGTLRWRVNVPRATRVAYAASLSTGESGAGAGAGAFVVVSEGRFVALDEVTGAIRWTVDAGDGIGLLVGSTGGMVVFADGAAPAMTLRAVDASTGEPRWERALPGTAFGAALHATSGGGVVAVARGDETGATLTVLDVASGEERWTAPVSGGIPDVTVPALDDDAVALLDRAGTVACFDAETGQLRWTKPIGGTNVAAQLVFSEHAVIWPTYVGSLAFDRTTGTTQSHPVFLGELKGLEVMGDTIVELVEVTGSSSVELRPAN